jgi:hypothetical protein
MINFSSPNQQFTNPIAQGQIGGQPEWVSPVMAPAIAMIVRFQKEIGPIDKGDRIGFLMFGLRSNSVSDEVAWLAESGQPVIAEVPYLFAPNFDLIAASNRNNTRPGAARLCAALWRSRYTGGLSVTTRSYY